MNNAVGMPMPSGGMEVTIDRTPSILSGIITMLIVLLFLTIAILGIVMFVKNRKEKKK